MLRTFGNYLLRYWLSEGMLILYQSSLPRFLRRQYRLGGRGGMGFAVSQGGAAAALEDGTVLGRGRSASPEFSGGGSRGSP
jgi:hypothetical protein